MCLSTVSNCGFLKKKKKRDRLEIIRDMLSTVLGKAKKTRIMYQSNLNYRQLEKYLNDLLESDLVKCNDDRSYLITWKGRNFLQTYANYLKRCKRIGDEMKGASKDRLQLENMCFSNQQGSKRVANRTEVLV